MSKAILELEEMPLSCVTCPFTTSMMVYVGDFMYTQKYRCQFEPEHVGDDNVYLNDAFRENRRKRWCPLKEVEG